MTKPKGPVDSGEKRINIEAVRVPPIRESYGDLTDLTDSIREQGLRHPITVWSDGTLISGARRLRSHFKLSAEVELPRPRHHYIKAVFIDTIEAAADRLMADSDDGEARPMTWSDVCRLWEVLRKLDAPADMHRRDAARRRGVELRRATLAGNRRPGRTSYSEDYFLNVVSKPFGISEATATRLLAIWSRSQGADRSRAGSMERPEVAVQAMKRLDAGESTIWAEYAALKGTRSFVARPRPSQVALPPAPAPKQLAAWARSLPQLEGLVAGLTEMGPPHPDLTPGQVAPIHDRLATVRRDLEKMIKQLKGTTQS